MKRLFKRRELTLVLVLAVLVAAISLRHPAFLQPGNVYDILNDTAILFMVAIGQMMVILTGGIDLSVSSGIALVGMSVGMLNRYYPGVPIAAIVLLALAMGFVLGAFNGLLVSLAGIPAIIATLGTLSIYRGFVFVLSGGQWVSAHEMTAGFRDLPHASPLGLTNLLLSAVVVVALAAVALRLTRTGREIYGVGGNRVAARYVGINLKRIDFLVFAVSGLIVGLSGLLWVARYASAQNETAAGFHLPTIAACVIGGVSILGGTGSVAGVVLGALFLGIVNNALPVINLSPFYQMALQGFVILAAIVANTLVEQRNQRLMMRKRQA
jgi:rhamnose transport system permease protein